MIPSTIGSPRGMRTMHTPATISPPRVPTRRCRARLTWRELSGAASGAAAATIPQYG
nr:hypothetical protein [Raineyella fluvialis]